MKLNAKFWRKANDARQDLANQLNSRSDVCSVDLGYPQNDGSTNGEISLRVHVCEDFDPADPRALPKDVNGIPVVVSHRSGSSRRRR